MGWGGLEEGESMCKTKFYRLNYIFIEISLRDIFILVMSFAKHSLKIREYHSKVPLKFLKLLYLHERDSGLRLMVYDSDKLFKVCVV